MKKFIPKVFFILCVCYSVFILAAESMLNINAIKETNIRNFTIQKNNVLTGGQPSFEQLKVLANSGVKYIINLRSIAEQKSINESDYVRALDMKYISIPVQGAHGITLTNAQTLVNTLQGLKGEPVYLHCASGNRVGALIALSAQEIDGENAEAAIKKGKQWGLTSLEPMVKAMLTDQ